MHNLLCVLTNQRAERNCVSVLHLRHSFNDFWKHASLWPLDVSRVLLYLWQSDKDYIIFVAYLVHSLSNYFCYSVRFLQLTCQLVCLSCQFHITALCLSHRGLLREGRLIMSGKEQMEWNQTPGNHVWCI
jgi:hypothetical protein